jgi:His-Xaa-Ser system protein HxsD
MHVGNTEALHTATISFDLKVFALDCVKRAAYRVTSNSSVDIAVEDGLAKCVLHFSKPISAELAARATEALRLEVLDQDLRNAVAQETASVRNAVLALAFSRSGLQTSD